MDKVFLCKTSDLDDEEVLKVENSEHGDIAVYNLGGQFYATADLCTHATASLAEGDVEDGMIVCPVHWGQFDITTGKAQGFPCEIDLRTFPVEVDGDDVYALVDPEQDDPSVIAKG